MATLSSIISFSILIDSVPLQTKLKQVFMIKKEEHVCVCGGGVRVQTYIYWFSVRFSSFSVRPNIVIETLQTNSLENLLCMGSNLN